MMDQEKIVADGYSSAIEAVLSTTNLGEFNSQLEFESWNADHQYVYYIISLFTNEGADPFDGMSSIVLPGWDLVKDDWMSVKVTE